MFTLPWVGLAAPLIDRSLSHIYIWDRKIYIYLSLSLSTSSAELCYDLTLLIGPDQEAKWEQVLRVIHVALSVCEREISSTFK